MKRPEGLVPTAIGAGTAGLGAFGLGTMASRLYRTAVASAGRMLVNATVVQKGL